MNLRRFLSFAPEFPAAAGKPFAISGNWSQAAFAGARYKLGTWIKPWKDSFGDMLFARQTDPLEIGNSLGRPKGAKPEEELRTHLEDWTRRTPRLEKL